jgi:hypothetical protein
MSASSRNHREVIYITTEKISDILQVRLRELDIAHAACP